MGWTYLSTSAYTDEIYDGSTLVSETGYVYDDYSGANGLAPRANVTQIKRWAGGTVTPSNPTFAYPTRKTDPSGCYVDSADRAGNPCSIRDASMAVQLGVNYAIYAMTH